MDDHNAITELEYVYLENVPPSEKQVFSTYEAVPPP